MGFKRKAIPAAMSAALALTAAGAGAAQAPEPLVITRLPERELIVTKAGSPASDQAPSIEDAMESFGRAIGQAIRVEQQAVQSACRTSELPKAGTPRAYDWRARCSYIRR